MRFKSLGRYYCIVRKRDRRVVHVFAGSVADDAEVCQSAVREFWGPKYQLKRVRIQELSK